MRFRSAVAVLSLTLVAAACSKEKPANNPATRTDSTTAEPGEPRWAGYVNRSLAAAVGDSLSTIEGLAEYDGKLYVIDWKDGAIYRLTPDESSPSPLLTVERVGELGIKPGTVILGVTAGPNGDLYATDPAGGNIYQVKGSTLGTPSFNTKSDVRVFATGAAGANGIGFDGKGNLWISGGDQNALYVVGPRGGKVKTFAKGFATINPDTTMPVRVYVTNGVAFDSKGNVYTANTGTGEIQRIEVKSDLTPGAISTLVKDARLYGADGLLIDGDDVVWVVANFRNALYRIGQDGSIALVTNDRPGMPLDSAGVRVSPDGQRMGSTDVLKFPAELRRVGNTIYVSNLNMKVGANQQQQFKGASVAGIRVQ